MNERVNKILSAGGKFTPEMHLTQPDLTYNGSGPLEIYKTVSGAAYADKNHTKIRCEYSAIKHWLRCWDILPYKK